MQGTGVGATYDSDRDVLWLLERAHVTVTPDEKGSGALDATAGAAGLARAEHYIKLTKTAHIDGEGRIARRRRHHDPAHATTTSAFRRFKLRGNSRITGSRRQRRPKAWRPATST